MVSMPTKDGGLVTVNGHVPHISVLKLSVGYIDGYMSLCEAAIDDHLKSFDIEDACEVAEGDLECASGDRHGELVVPNQHAHRRMG